MGYFGINISYWIMQTVAMLLTALLIPRLRINGPLPALLTVVCLAFFNAHFWDAALFFNLPTRFSQASLVLFALNGVFFWILIKLLPGIEVKGFLPALVAPVVFTLCSLGIERYGSQIDWLAVYRRSTATIALLKEYAISPEKNSSEETMRAMPRSSDAKEARY